MDSSYIYVKSNLYYKDNYWQLSFSNDPLNYIFDILRFSLATYEDGSIFNEIYASDSNNWTGDYGYTNGDYSISLKRPLTTSDADKDV